MIKSIINNNYRVILYTKNSNLTYILNDTIEDLKSSDDVINWYNFSANDTYFNDNGEPLHVLNIDNIEKIIILEIC